MDTKSTWKRTSYHNLEQRPPYHRQTPPNSSRSIKTWSMFGSLTLGIVLAAGHAGFYYWLNGRPVNDTVSQTWVTNIGVALAFGSRMMLMVASSIAFAQYQWHTFRAHSYEVKEIDNIVSLLDDMFSLVNFRLWPKVPVLVLIAIITWLIPIAAIFPPGTIHVAFSPVHHNQALKVAQLALSNNSNWATRAGTVGTNNYQDASPFVYTAALTAGSSGEISSIPHQYTNMTYDYQFQGPAVQCSRTTDQLRDILVSHINSTGSGGGYFYISFVGGDDHGLFNASGLQCEMSGNTSLCYRPNTLLDADSLTFATLDETSNDTARLYTMLSLPGNYNLFECDLWNATYYVNSHFKESTQTIEIQQLEYHNQVATNLSAQGSCLAETGIYANGCIESSTVLSYQAIMQAFGSLYVGTLYGHYELYTRYLTLVESLSTAPNFTANVDPTEFLKNMETQFQNITLSMLSFPSLRANDSRAEDVPVIWTEYPATYEFSPLKLYLAYGIAVGCTLICILIGLYALNINGVGYSNKFSSFVRMAKSTQLYNTIDDVDNAADPCPENIKRRRITALVDRGNELNSI